MNCGVGHRHGSDPTLLWLWCRQAATALIRPLAWEPPYAVGVALKGQKTKKKKYIYIYMYVELAHVLIIAQNDWKIFFIQEHFFRGTTA